MKTLLRAYHSAAPSLPLALVWAALASPSLHAQLQPPAFPAGDFAPSFYVGYELLTGRTTLGPVWGPPTTSGGYLVSDEPAALSELVVGKNTDSFATSQARAGFDGLGVSSHAEAFGLFNLVGSGAVVRSPDGLPHYGSLAAMTWHDNLVSGPGSTTTTRQNLRLDGAQLLSHSPLGPSVPVLETGLAIIVRVSYTLPGEAETTIQFDGTYARSVGTVNLFSATGLLASYGGSGNLDIFTPYFEVPVGTPFALTWVLASAAAASTTQFEAETSLAEMDFLHTLTFPADGPILNLGPGLSYNAPSMGIVDNHVEAVPEPGTWGALVAVAGLTAAGWLRRRSPSL